MERPTAPAAALAAALSVAAPADAQQPAPRSPLPDVPTTKIIALARVTEKWSLEAARPLLLQEVRDTVGLHLAGKIDQWWMRKDKPGVVFLLNTGDIEEAKRFLDALPFDKAGLMTFDLIPVGPLAPLGVLLREAAP